MEFMQCDITRDGYLGRVEFCNLMRKKVGSLERTGKFLQATNNLLQLFDEMNSISAEHEGVRLSEYTKLYAFLIDEDVSSKWFEENLNVWLKKEIKLPIHEESVKRKRRKKRSKHRHKGRLHIAEKGALQFYQWSQTKEGQTFLAANGQAWLDSKVKIPTEAIESSRTKSNVSAYLKKECENIERQMTNPDNIELVSNLVSV